MGITAKSRARLTWPQAGLGPRGSYHAYRSAAGGGAADVDYAAPIEDAPIEAWPDGEIAGGFGAGGFGERGFGDNGPGAGFGLGGFGAGGLGAGELELNWDSPPLADARYGLAVAAIDEAGNDGEPAAVADELVMAGEPLPPARLRPSAYAGGLLALTFTLSADDEES